MPKRASQNLLFSEHNLDPSRGKDSMARLGYKVQIHLKQQHKIDKVHLQLVDSFYSSSLMGPDSRALFLVLKSLNL